MRVGIDYTSAVTQREGIGRVTRELVRAVLELPERPDLRLLYAHRGPVREADALGVHERVEVRRIPVSPRVSLAVWQRARLPDLIEAVIGPLHVVHGPDFTLPPRLLAPGVLTVHDLAFVTRPQDAHPAQRRFLEEAVPRSIDRARLIVAVSESTKRDLMLRLGVRPHRIRVIPNAVADDFGPECDQDRLEEVRRRLELPQEFVLSVGTIHPRKNLGGLAAAVATAGRRLGRELQAVHVGREGWLVERVYADVRAAGSGFVRFVGQVDDRTLRALYTLAKVCAYPSFSEGFGLPVLEAFACGCPVVTSDTPGTAEVAGGAAILVDPHDPEAIAEGIMTVVEEWARCSDLQRRGEVRRRDFSWRRSARALLEVYREARRGEPQPHDSRAEASGVE